AHRGARTRPTPTDRARCPPPHARRGGGHRELPASPRGFGARRPLEHGTHDRDSHPRPALAAGREQRRNAVGRSGRGVQDGETVPLKKVLQVLEVLRVLGVLVLMVLRVLTVPGAPRAALNSPAPPCN